LPVRKPSGSGCARKNGDCQRPRRSLLPSRGVKAMTVDPQRLEGFRSYLLVMAELHLPARFRRQCDIEDVVQRAFARAVAGLPDFRGDSDAELAGWLRTILRNVLADLARKLDGQCADVGRERSVEALLQESSARLDRLLVA